MPALLDADKARVRYHLDYPMLDDASLVIAGAVMRSDIRFVLEDNMNNVNTDALTYVPALLDKLDAIELQKIDAHSRFQALKADVVTLNTSEEGQLQGQYIFWRNRICNALAVTPNPFAIRDMTNSLNFSR